MTFDGWRRQHRSESGQGRRLDAMDEGMIARRLEAARFQEAKRRRPNEASGRQERGPESIEAIIKRFREIGFKPAGS